MSEICTFYILVFEFLILDFEHFVTSFGFDCVLKLNLDLLAYLAFVHFSYQFWHLFVLHFVIRVISHVQFQPMTY